jgi:PhoH-like ATPase
MQKRLFILDTNVLMHDPTAIFRFQEHAIYLSMIVLEELDAAKKGMSEVSRNVRQVSRFLDDLISAEDDLTHGVTLPTATENNENGCLYFQTELLPESDLTKYLPGNKPDNTLLSTAITLKQTGQFKDVTLVSKDINMRIKAHVLGICAEDYTSDKALDDMDLLYSGMEQLTDDFWEQHSKSLDAWKEEGRTFYKVTGPAIQHWHTNQFLYADNESHFNAIVRECNDEFAKMELAKDFTVEKNSVWGINARNIEQNFALNLLTDPEIDFVTLVGPAGTGKTLLALAAGLAQTLDQSLYREIIVTRVTIPVGEDIGFLPGTEEEKMTPWMGALVDNLEVLAPTQEGGDWGRAATADLLHNRIKVRSLNFMRGRTFLNRYIILDEAQNLTPKQMKTFVTRAGPGSKIICLGNVAQIDTPYLTETSSGLTYVVDKFKHWEHSGHVTLQRGERSRLADFASVNL